MKRCFMHAVSHMFRMISSVIGLYFLKTEH